MPSLNFSPRFADQVASGAKRQSIRARQFSVGSTAYLFTGMRTAHCRRLGAGTVIRVRDVLIDYRSYVPVIKLDGVTLAAKRMEEFARQDGFPGLDEFIDFFAEYYELPFKGFLIEWDLQEQAVAA